MSEIAEFLSHAGENTAPSRRFALALPLMSLAICAIVSPQRALAALSSNEVRAGSWVVGGRLSLATMAYFRGTGPHENFLKGAQSIADELGVAIPPLPPKPAKSTDGIIAMLDYFNKGDGASIGSAIRNKYGDDAGTLYITAARTFQMPLIYDLDPSEADKFVQLIRGNMARVKVPDSLWKPALDLVGKRAKFEEVKAALIKMYDDVIQYLLKA